MNSNVRPRGTDQAKVIQVIETISALGAGTENDPVRTLRQYWSLDGEFLARQDSRFAITVDADKVVLTHPDGSKTEISEDGLTKKKQTFENVMQLHQDVSLATHLGFDADQ